MPEAGRKLKQVREQLNLKYRDVEEASLRIAKRHGNSEFALALSRLADIENKGTLPTIYRLYTLCAIYRLKVAEVLRWYGVDLGDLAADAASIGLEATHLFGLEVEPGTNVALPVELDPVFDPRRTTYLNRVIKSWGRLPLALLGGLDLKKHQYGFIGTEDWFMHPLIPPGAFVLIDGTRKKIARGGWASEHERPVYFFELRSGYACGWVHLIGSLLVLQPHPASKCSPKIYSYPDEIEVVGRVTGVATRLDQASRRRVRSSTTRAASPDQTGTAAAPGREPL